VSGESLVGEQAVDRREIAKRVEIRHSPSVSVSLLGRKRGQQRTKQLRELRSGLRTDGEDSLVLDAPLDDPRSHVRDDRDAEAAKAEVPRRDHLGDRRHPREVAPNGAHEADLGGGLELGPEPASVDTLHELDPEPSRRLVRGPAELRVVRRAHVREARPELVVVGSDER